MAAGSAGADRSSSSAKALRGGLAKLVGENAPLGLERLPPLSRRLRATMPVRHSISRRDPGAAPKLLLFSQSRCGSTLLIDLINTHPSIDCRGEIYLQAPFLPVLLRKSLERGRRAPVFGFKLQVHQLDLKLRLPAPRRFVEEMVEDGYVIVYLRRRNVLRHALSETMRAASGLTHVRTDAQAETVERTRSHQIRVDVETLRGAMAVREYYWRAADAVLEGLPHQSVEYEHDLLDPARHQSVATAIFGVLGLEPVTVATQLRRINDLALTELVENYDELAQGLRETPWQHFLEEN